MRTIKFLLFLFLASFFTKGCKEESADIYIEVKNESQNDILIVTSGKTTGGNIDSFRIKANKTKTIIDYMIWGCEHGAYSHFGSEEFVKVYYDDSISIPHYNSHYVVTGDLNLDTISTRSLTESVYWPSCETDECVFVNTYTFTDADYQEAVDKQ
ncbi:MAG: hypothetical protein ACPGEG_10115 [Salibacteraceae bacterium]